MKQLNLRDDCYRGELSNGETVAVYNVIDGRKEKIAQLAVPDYVKIERAYNNDIFVCRLLLFDSGNSF